jgi:hypothetical protein
MEKKPLNSNVVSAAQLLYGFALVLLISASLAIKLLEVRNQSPVLEVENALWE